MLEIPLLGKIGAPFMVAATVGAAATVNKTRVVEAVVIGLIMAAGGKFLALPVLTEQIETVNANIARVDERVKVVEQKLETRRQIRDEQMDVVKRDMNSIKVEQARRR